MTALGTLYSQANTTRDLQTGIQVWLGIGIQLISGLTETLLVRAHILTYTWLTHKVSLRSKQAVRKFRSRPI